MARLSSVFDSELNEQVFMLRGDENYARSTVTVFEQVGNLSLHELSYDVTVKLDVLRDRGDGMICVYDNDNIIQVYKNNVLLDEKIQWKSTDNEVSVLVKGLTYGVEHNLYARYMGNTQCSPSKSKTITLNVENPNLFETHLTLDTVQSFNYSNVTKTVTLSNSSQDNTFNIEQELTVYLDDNYINTITTDNTETATINLGTISEGLHELTIKFHGTDNLSESSVTQKISQGIDITINTPRAIMIGDNVTITGTVKDFLGEVPPFDVGHVCWGNTLLGEVHTSLDSNGSFSLTHYIDPRYSIEEYNLYKEQEVIFFFDMPSDTYCWLSLNYVEASSVTISHKYPVMAKNNVNTFTIQTTPVQKGLPVHITGTINNTYTTDSNGQVKIDVTGTGKGTKSITAKCGTKSATVTLNDYVQYWDKTIGYEANMDYRVQNTSLLSLNNMYKLTGTDSKAFALILSPDTIDFKLTLYNVSGQVGVACIGTVDDSENIVIPESISMTYYNGAVPSGTALTIKRKNGNTGIALAEDVDMSSYGVITKSPAIVFRNDIPITYNGSTRYPTLTDISFTKLTLEEI